MTAAPSTTELFDLETIVGLYRRYLPELRAARESQRELLATTPLRAKLDDLEAEILYLAVRETRPARVVELGSFDGWSTTWLLRALRDNDFGELHSYDLRDAATRHVPPDLAERRWTFVPGDARLTCRGAADLLFVDAAHTARFARWYTRELFDRLEPGTPVAVHDVFHGRRPWPNSEGRVVLSWLADRSRPYLTPSASAAPDTNDRLRLLKGKLHVAAKVHSGADNPMLFFTR